MNLVERGTSEGVRRETRWTRLAPVHWSNPSPMQARRACSASIKQAPEQSGAATWHGPRADPQALQPSACPRGAPPTPSSKQPLATLENAPIGRRVCPSGSAPAKRQGRLGCMVRGRAKRERGMFRKDHKGNGRGAVKCGSEAHGTRQKRGLLACIHIAGIWTLNCR